jgi:hypothetical protein
MIIDCKELVFELLFIHKRGFFLGSFQENFNSHFMYDLDKKIIGYENVLKLLEAIPKFVWIPKLWEGQIVMQCS